MRILAFYPGISAILVLAASLLFSVALPASAPADDGTCAMGCSHASRQWYFTEGFTGPGFQEWLCVLNPSTKNNLVHLDFLYNGASPSGMEIDLPPLSRSTLNVNHLAGEGREVSVILTGAEPVVAERPMYFTYGNKWKGCTTGQGSDRLSERWYFAEGCTREGFEEWLLLANPSLSENRTRLDMVLENGQVLRQEVLLSPLSRGTVFVNGLTGEGHDVSLRVEADLPLCAERVMYFRYRNAWCGGHSSSGFVCARDTHYFAEGYTGPGFEEYLCLYLPGDAGRSPVEVTVRFLFAGGPHRELSLTVESDRRYTLNVNHLVGEGREVAMEVVGTGRFLAERPMYFNYRGFCRGGHVSTGAESPGNSWFLAEGTTRPGFHPYLCILNPGGEEADVGVDLIGFSGELLRREVAVPSLSRYTLNLREILPRGVDFSIRVTSDLPVVVERPLYYPTADFETANAMENIRRLSMDIGPRVEGTAGEEAAASFLSSLLANYGYKVEIQVVPLPNGLYTRNVVAALEDGSLATGEPRKTLVVGGHYDTKGRTGSPGANDNASGTAVVLELARCLSERGPLPGLRLEFVLFGGEERLVDGTDLHHFGSRYYVASLTPEEKTSLYGAIIVDMVGVGTQLYARTMGIGPMDLCNALLAYSSGIGVRLPYLQSGNYSDHEPFEKAGIPAVWLEVKDDPWYHTPQDIYEKIDPRHVEHVGRLLLGFIIQQGS